jgi:rRNA-processing protein FCF1
MLDTNTLDYIYDNKITLVSKLRNFAKKHIHLYITHIQQDEINKMTDNYKKSCINKIISNIGIRRILTSSAIIGIDEPSKHGFIGSSIGMYEFVDDIDLPILEKLQKHTLSNPMDDTADLSILYTAVKKKMDYLITDDNHFESMLKEMSKDIPNNLELKKNHDLDYF